MPEKGAPPNVHPVGRRVLKALETLSTPLLPDDYLEMINPLWSTRELRGRVVDVRPETANAATILIKPGHRWPGHMPGQFIHIGVDIDGVRHWRAYSLTSDPYREDGLISISPKCVEAGKVSPFLVGGADPGTIVMFGAELRALAQRRDGFQLHEQLTRDNGRMGPQDVDALCPDWCEREAFMSGPADMLDAFGAHWERHGDGQCLHVERFQPKLALGHSGAGEGGTVTFLTSNCRAESDGHIPILVAGEEAGLELPYGCREGICHTCVGELRSGQVRDLRNGEVYGQDGEMVRTCISAPEGPVEIEL